MYQHSYTAFPSTLTSTMDTLSSLTFEDPAHPRELTDDTLTSESREYDQLPNDPYPFLNSLGSQPGYGHQSVMVMDPQFNTHVSVINTQYHHPSVVDKLLVNCEWNQKPNASFQLAQHDSSLFYLSSQMPITNNPSVLNALSAMEFEPTDPSLPETVFGAGDDSDMSDSEDSLDCRTVGQQLDDEGSDDESMAMNLGAQDDQESKVMTAASDDENEDDEDDEDEDLDGDYESEYEPEKAPRRRSPQSPSAPKLTCNWPPRSLSRRTNGAAKGFDPKSEDKPFFCGECNKVFAKQNSLNNHLQSKAHSDIKRFRCEDCPKAYQTQANLTRHRTHKHVKEGEEVQHACSHVNCDKTFRGFYDLRIHYQNIHLKKEKGNRRAPKSKGMPVYRRRDTSATLTGAMSRK